MKNEIIYEWDIETVEIGSEDIINHDYSDKLVRLPEEFNELNRSFERLVLVRQVGSEADGEIDRTWAYVENGRLPKFFIDSAGVKGTKVPMKYHIELMKFYLNK